MQALGLTKGLTKDAAIQMIEVIGVQPVGIRPTVARLLLMLLHARLLDEMVGLFIGRAILFVDHLAFHKLPQSVEGVAGRDAVTQR